MQSMNNILIAAYPKSGSTWLTRLVGDVLNSTTAGSWEDEADIINAERGGKYLIRRGHYVLVDTDSGPVIPASHQLAWKRLADERIIFLVRDPRDICVSGSHYWQIPIEQFLDQMIAGTVAGIGRWDEYVRKWYYLDYQKITIIRYRNLLNDTHLWLRRALIRLNIPYSAARMLKVVERLSFEKQAANMDGDELRRNNMRLGIAGDWRNYFTPVMNKRILNEFGAAMEIFGYE
jgi:hypothetical protein